MKKMLLLLTVFFGLNTASFADGKLIETNQLPILISSYVSQHFTEQQISYATKEREGFKTEYKIMLTNGSELKFNGDGEWISLDGKINALPESVIPIEIRNYVAEKFPNVSIIEISRKNTSFEVELSNKLELRFNGNREFVGVDD